MLVSCLAAQIRTQRATSSSNVIVVLRILHNLSVPRISCQQTTPGGTSNVRGLDLERMKSLMKGRVLRPAQRLRTGGDARRQAGCLALEAWRTGVLNLPI